MRTRFARTLLAALLAVVLGALVPAHAKSGVVHYHTWDFELDIQLDGVVAGTGAARGGAGTADLQLLAGGLRSLKLACLAVDQAGAVVTIRAVGVDPQPAQGLPADENWEAVDVGAFRLHLVANTTSGASSFGVEEIAPGANAASCAGWSVPQRQAIGYQYFWVAGA